MKFVATICCLFLTLNIAVSADIEKTAIICNTGICFYWWPKLPRVPGWHEEKNASFEYGANALAPDGFSFGNATAVMYALAAYKPRVPETKSLEEFIAGDRSEFVASTPGIVITEVGAMTTGDGAKLRSFTFFPHSKGNWEQVSYGEEGDYYLVFTLSSRSKQGFDQAQSAYRYLLAHYKAKL